MNNKKGQAAMEFLMTYGWAILVVLVAIAALAYFGVLNPQRFLPSSCTIAPGISCDDYKIEATQMTLILRNGMGDDLTAVTVASTGCTTTTPVAWNNGNTIQADLVCTNNGAVGARFKQDVVIAYTSGSGLTHSKTGTITTQVE